MRVLGITKSFLTAGFMAAGFAVSAFNHYFAPLPLEDIDPAVAKCDFNNDDVLDITEATIAMLEQFDLNGDRKIISKEEVTKAREFRDKCDRFRYNLRRTKANFELASLPFTPAAGIPILSNDGTEVRVLGGPQPFEVYRDKDGTYKTLL